MTELRLLGHDVLTVKQAGKANQRIPDPQVLAYAITLGRAVITLNRRHFIKLHTRTRPHRGIIVCTDDKNVTALAQRIQQAILRESTLDNKLIRVNKPRRP